MTNYDALLQYRLRPRELGPGVPGFLYGRIETDPDSGGTRWFLSQHFGGCQAPSSPTGQITASRSSILSAGWWCAKFRSGKSRPASTTCR